MLTISNRSGKPCPDLFHLGGIQFFFAGSTYVVDTVLIAIPPFQKININVILNGHGPSKDNGVIYLLS
jgi:hypothetical protein